MEGAMVFIQIMDQLAEANTACVGTHAYVEDVG